MSGSDLRLAIRTLVRTPAFAVPAIASIALGIAVNTTMFSLVDALLLRPLAPSASGNLVRINRSMNDDGSFRSVSPGEFEFLEQQASSFSDLLGSEITSVVLNTDDEVQFVPAEIVTPNYFHALERTPAEGRGFDEVVVEESAVISDRLWRRQFGGAETVVGHRVLINNQPFTIVGIAPAGFNGSFPGVGIDVWLPVIWAQSFRDASPRRDPRAVESMDVMGILNTGVSIDAARTELDVLSRRLSELDPGRDPARGFVVVGAMEPIPPSSASSDRFPWG